MREAVIVSAARTPIGKAFRGAFNKTHGATLMGQAIEHAVSRAGVEPAEVEDVIVGCGYPEGATGFNLARRAAISSVRCSTARSRRAAGSGLGSGLGGDFSLSRSARAAGAASLLNSGT